MGLNFQEAALGIHRIANAATMRALREVSTHRGRDPRDFSLIAFGGSGPIQAAGLGRQLRVPQIIIPPLPGLFSAVGLLVSDVEMPRLNGFELTERIRNDDQLAQLPVVLVTARGSREDRERGIDAGANAYIVKSSFDQSNLLGVVGRLI